MTLSNKSVYLSVVQSFVLVCISLFSSTTIMPNNSRLPGLTSFSDGLRYEFICAISYLYHIVRENSVGNCNHLHAMMQYIRQIPSYYPFLIVYMSDGHTELEFRAVISAYITMYDGRLSRFKNTDAWYAEYWARTPSTTIKEIEEKYTI